MKLKLILITIQKSQLNKDLLGQAVDIVKNAYREAFSTNNNVAVEVVEGSGSGIDFAIAFDQAPSVPNATAKFSSMVQMVGERLNNMIPGQLSFQGKGKYMPLSNVKKTDLPAREQEENEFEQLARQYVAEKPRYRFSQIVLSKEVQREFDEALAVLTNRELLFDKWGLKSIMSPSVLLNLYGASGTGKTMAAEAIADKLGKNIIKATYADIESKWHGEGPQKLKAIFLAAQKQDAVLFIDEADSMLSNRLSSVSNGSEQAINSMRSQLLICLENFDGVVVFATNLIKNYDPAFLTRLICVEIPKPDTAARREIWHRHLYPAGDTEVQLNIPSSGDWNIDTLAENYEFVGRDIRNAVKKACIIAVTEQDGEKSAVRVAQKHLVDACEAVQKQKKDLEKARNSTNISFRKISKEQEEEASGQIAKALLEKASANNSLSQDTQPSV